MSHTACVAEANIGHSSINAPVVSLATRLRGLHNEHHWDSDIKRYWIWERAGHHDLVVVMALDRVGDLARGLQLALCDLLRCDAVMMTDSRRWRH